MSTIASRPPPPAIDLQTYSSGRKSTLTKTLRRRLLGRNINLLINLTLLVLVIVTFVSGVIASMLGLTEFGLHRYASVALLALAATHVGLRFRSMTTRLRGGHVRGRRKTDQIMGPGDVRSD
jgi:hypothetical protein